MTYWIWGQWDKDQAELWDFYFYSWEIPIWYFSKETFKLYLHCILHLNLLSASVNLLSL